MFDNLKIGKKLLLLSGSILLLLAITVLWAAFGLSRTVQNGAMAAGGNKLRSDMLHLEIKHDAWNNKVRSFLSDPENHELKVKLDPQTCALGVWYYGEERRQAEAMLPEISTELAALEEPHRRMHESGKKILEVYKPADPKLPITLSDLETSHVNWLGAVQNALLAGHKQILAEGDPEKCGLGQFLHSEQAKKAAEQSPEMAELLKGIAEPHKKLHALVPRMNEALAAADRRELHYLYEDEMMPLLAEVRYMLRSLKRQAEKDLVGLNKAEEIYQTETLPSLMELKGHLSRIAEISEQSVISDQEMLAVAGNTRNGVITIGAFALLLGGFLAYLISRSLTVPMRKTVAMISDLENGHLDTRLEMKRKDEIGQLAETMDLFADSLQHEVVYSLQKLAGGDLTFEIAPTRRARHDPRQSAKTWRRPQSDHAADPDRQRTDRFGQFPGQRIGSGLVGRRRSVGRVGRTDQQFDERNRQPDRHQRGKCRTGQPTGRFRPRSSRQRQPAHDRNDPGHGGNQQRRPEHQQNHQSHRRDRLPDQPVGAQRGGRSGPGRAARQGVRSGCGGSAEPGGAQCQGSVGNGGTDRGLGGQDQQRDPDRRADSRCPGRDRRFDRQGDRPDRRDCRGQP